MNIKENIIFEQVDIGLVSAKDKHFACNIDDCFYIVAIKNKNEIIKIDGEYISLDCDSIYVLKDVGRLGFSEDLIVIMIKGELCDKYIKNDVLDSVLKFSAHTKIMRLINDFIDHKVKLGDIEEKKKFSMAMDMMIDIVFYNPIKSKKTNKIVNDALYYIHEYYYEIYGIDQLCDRLNVSKSYLIRMFKIQMDITPLNYIQQFKTAKAKRFLLEESLDIKTIANLCGYSCANYFSKVFKKESGVSPCEFRKLNQDKKDDSLPDEFYL